MINKISKRKFDLIKNDEELRNKFIADQIAVGLKYQLRALRESQGLTQKELADLLNTKQSVISRFENKPERLSIPTLLDIGEVFDVAVVVRFESIDTFLEWHSNPSQKKMTPRKSKEVLKKLERLFEKQEVVEKSDILDEEILEESQSNTRNSQSINTRRNQRRNPNQGVLFLDENSVPLEGGSENDSFQDYVRPKKKSRSLGGQIYSFPRGQAKIRARG